MQILLLWGLQYPISATAQFGWPRVFFGVTYFFDSYMEETTDYVIHIKKMHSYAKKQTNMQYSFNY